MLTFESNSSLGVNNIVEKLAVRIVLGPPRRNVLIGVSRACRSRRSSIRLRPSTPSRPMATAASLSSSRESFWYVQEVTDNKRRC